MRKSMLTKKFFINTSINITVKTNNGSYSDVDSKLVPRKENTEHGLEVRKIYLQKVTKDSVRVSGAYYPVVSNIGSRTTN